MKTSEIIHRIAAITMFIGILALFGAWIATASGNFLGISEEHLFNDAKSLLLISIGFGIATLVHQNLERRR